MQLPSQHPKVLALDELLRAVKMRDARMRVFPRYPVSGVALPYPIAYYETLRADFMRYLAHRHQSPKNFDERFDKRVFVSNKRYHIARKLRSIEEQIDAALRSYDRRVVLTPHHTPDRT